ncbi:cytohesin-interacting protein-like [Astyanax mexicanus]|uniref:Cytohesin 1 interacting protein n=3 Tax=Astyanax mexicanus TaxID=7994 RepID=A0A8B9R8L7_ASTMX|nr:cytohesin-interacting protein-like [Astyanax mexicanus]
MKEAERERLVLTRRSVHQRRMSSSITYIKKLIRKGSRTSSFSRPKPAHKKNYVIPEEHTHKEAPTNTQHMSHDSKRESVLMSKQDSEAFGFEIRTYNEQMKVNSSEEDVLTCVCSVRENSLAESAGLRTGDVIISVNSVCVEGFEHQQIVDLIQSSCLLKMEILRGTTVKQKELQKKLNHIQWQLNQKWEELQMLIAQEERLLRGDQTSTHSEPCPASEHPSLPITVP